MIHSLAQFNLPLDVEAFITKTKGCPDEPEIIQELWQKIKPAIFWKDLQITSCTDGKVVLGKGQLTIDSYYVAKGLAQCHKATVMALTIGSPLPDDVTVSLDNGSFYRGSIGDLVGSHSVEMLAARFTNYLQERAMPQGLFATLRFSPGYGDWPLLAQPQIMDLLEQCKGQITLTENYLLEPVKSITAIICWSNTWQKPEYPQGNHGCGFFNGGNNCAACTTWVCRNDQ